jgi:diguanylate cyclase (GGDEF)-like protein/PAS domain S-box-containing protein
MQSKGDSPELRLAKLCMEAMSKLSRTQAIDANPSSRTPEQLIHELEVYQIELELQNDALRRANVALEQSRDRYLELYEFAPLGYVTLTADNWIAEISVNAALLFGGDRESLIGQAFADLVAPAETDRWHQLMQDVRPGGARHSVEMALARRDGAHFLARLNCICVDIDQNSRGIRIAITDLSEVAELRRVAEESKIAATIFESQEGMLITDARGVILRVNHAFTEISGFSEDELRGQSMRILKSSRHAPAFYSTMWKRIQQTGSWQGEIWSRRKDNEIFPALITVTGVKGHGAIVTHYVGTMIDITQRKAAADEIQNLAFYDSLTHLPNRRLLMDRLSQAMATSARSCRKGALLFVDLDDFKTLNNTLGHHIGDLLLVQVAQRLSSCVREGDTVARLGGDEFVVVLEELDEDFRESAAQAEHIGEKMLLSLKQTFSLQGHENHSGASIGVTLFNAHETSMEELMKRADLAMYQAKGAGRNALRFFDPDMQAIVNARAKLESALRSALTKQEFILHFQPQVQGDGHMLGCEALVRWQYPLGGLILPDEFIHSAEQTGLIVPLGLWILQSACAQLAAWAEHPETANLTMSVNVSARQLQESNFVKQVLTALERSGANPIKLRLELTESVLLADADDVAGKMMALKDKGVRFSLDDFGTGYSALTCLKRLPLDQLKIDRSFIGNMLTDANDSAIALTVVALAKSMNLDVMAEGVETVGQRDFLARHGCLAYQGFLFSPPLSAEDLGKLVLN